MLALLCLTLTSVLLITFLILFYQSTESLLLGMKCVTKHQDFLIFVPKLNKCVFFNHLLCDFTYYVCSSHAVNPLTAGAAYIRVFIFY